MAHQGILVLASEKITVVKWASADWLILVGHVVQYLTYEGIPNIGTRDYGVHFPKGFAVASSLALVYSVMKWSIHIPLNQIMLLIQGKVRRWNVVYGKNCEAVPPGLRY